MGRRGNDQILLKAAALGAVAGMRSMSAPALLSHELAEDGPDRGDGPVERLLSSERVSRVLAILAGAEMLADKSSFVPDRTSALPLIGRAVMGSLTAGAYAAHRRHPVLLPAAVGAASAIACTFASYHARRFAGEHLDVPDRLLGLVEDAIVLGIVRSLADELD